MTRTLLLLVAVPAALALAAPAAAKEGAQARVTTAIPADARPGERVHVAWTLELLDRDGSRTPSNAIGVFVRLRSASGGAPTIGFATPTAHADGRYDADVTVPAGGVGNVEIGLRGSTDVVFPLLNSPIVPGDGSDRSGMTPALWLAPAFALAALLALALAARRRRTAARPAPA